MAQQFGEALNLDMLDNAMRSSKGLQSGRLTGGSEARQMSVAKDDDQDLILDWISELSALKGVPLNYLVPDMAMLPAESLRFFRVDRAWIVALLDGAFSLGRPSTDANSRESQMIDLAAEKVETCQLRGAMLAEQLGDSPANNHFTYADMSGFFLRSELLVRWPGLEVQGFDGSGQNLSIVRMELVAPGVLLCLFNRELCRVRFKGPAESGHFGVGLEEGRMVKQLRTIGDSAPPLEKVDVPLRSGGRRVVSLARLADSMGKRPDTPVTAAEFAVHMTESAELVEFFWSAP